MILIDKVESPILENNNARIYNVETSCHQVKLRFWPLLLAL